MQNERKDLIAHLRDAIEQGEPSSKRLMTLGELSAELSVPLFAVRRAAKSGQFPTYKIGNGRARARLSEVIAAITASSQGVP